MGKMCLTRIIERQSYILSNHYRVNGSYPSISIILFHTWKNRFVKKLLTLHFVDEIIQANIFFISYLIKQMTISLIVFQQILFF